MWSDTLTGGRTGIARTLGAVPHATPLVLVAARDVALWLESRAGLPSYVTVLAARTNPWLRGCPRVTVEMRTTAGVRLDTKTFQLIDGWLDGTDDLFSWGSRLDCLNTTTLTARTHSGSVVFVMLDPANGAELGRSAPFSLATLPAGAAIDEQPSYAANAAATVAQTVAATIQGAGDVIAGAAETTGIPRLVRYAAAGAAAAAVLVYGPTLLAAVKK